MPSYTYKARDRHGEMLTATVEAKDDMELAASLRTLNYSVISIEKKEPHLGAAIADLLQRLKKSRQYEVVFFSRQLASLLKAGIPILNSLSSIAEQTKDKVLKEAINAVSRDIQAGLSFSEALAKHPDIFQEVYVSTIKVGETTGGLDQILERLAQLGMREYEIKTQIKSAMIYPIILVTVAVCVVTFLLINIIPKFVVVFESYGARLPLPTQILLGISFVVQRLWFVVLFVIIALVFGVKKYIKTEKGRYKYDRFLLHIPLFGELYLKVLVSRICRTLSTMVKSGVSILEALYVTGKTVKNMVLRRVMENVHSAVSEGQPLSEPFRMSGVFPSTVVQMMSLGEKSGKLDQMLMDVASFYDEEVDYTIKNMTTALEPLLLLGMGLMVAFIALSVLLPIFNLIKVFRH